MSLTNSFASLSRDLSFNKNDINFFALKIFSSFNDYHYDFRIRLHLHFSDNAVERGEAESSPNAPTLILLMLKISHNHPQR